MEVGLSLAVRCGGQGAQRGQDGGRAPDGETAARWFSGGGGAVVSAGRQRVGSREGGGAVDLRGPGGGSVVLGTGAKRRPISYQSRSIATLGSWLCTTHGTMHVASTRA